MAKCDDNLDFIQSYPIFKANQVLTDKQLNGIIGYLEQQERLTRVFITGMGIICGLRASWNEPILSLSAGYGITSEGYLIKTPDCTFKAFREVDILPQWFGLDSHDALLSNIYELEISKEVNNLQIMDLTADQFINRVLTLVLECREDANDDFCHDDCDERGKNRYFILHYLLIPVEVADIILLNGYDPEGNFINEKFNNLQELFYFKYLIPHPCIERLIHLNKPGETAPLTDITTYKIFLERYQTVLGKLVSHVSEALSNVHKVFSPVFTPGEVKSKIVFNDLFADIKSGKYRYISRLEIQYIYDYLSDLVYAYQEFAESAFDLMADCPAVMCKFPRHLLIGSFNKDGILQSDPSVYRTPYTQPVIYNGNHKRLEETRTLFERLQRMVTGYRTPDFIKNNETRITPDKSEAYPLSRRAMPYYYTPLLMEWWNPQRRRMGRKTHVYSYHQKNLSPVAGGFPPYTDPLVFKMEGSDFLRIEGHIGKPFEEVLTELADYKQKYNLPFQVVALKIAEKSEEELILCGCEDLECEKDRLRSEYVKVRKNLNDILDNYQNPQLYKYETLFELVKDLIDTLTIPLDKFNFTYFEIAYDTLEQSEAYQKLERPFLPVHGKEPFMRLWKCFAALKNRSDTIKNKYLFHRFAGVYPGMEHGAGVPFGGTFIIVYADPENLKLEISQLISYIESLKISAVEKKYRKEIAKTSRLIVGDFYLPYACLSCVPPICQVISRPVPIFVVSPTIFCGQDTKANELSVIAYPGGGLIHGPGYKFEEGKHLFTPAGTGVDHGIVTLKYYVDGGEASFDLSIVKPPDAHFEVIDKQNEPITNICQDHGLLYLIPVTPEGEFSAWMGETELDDIIGTDENYKKTLDPTKLIFENENPLTIEIRYTVVHNFCTSIFKKIIIVSPVPDASFTFKGDVTEICKENGSIQLLPTTEGGSFAAYINNQLINGAILKDENDNWFFNSAVINLGKGENVQVIIRHTIISQFGCFKSVDQQILVYSSPDSDFARLRTSVCQNSNPIPLNPVYPGGVFTAESDSGENPAGLIVENILYPNRITSEIVVTITITHSLVNGPCVSRTVKSIRIIPLPDASFSFEGGVTEICVKNGRIKLLPKISDGRFFAYLDPNGSPINGAIINEAENWYFNPAVFKIKPGEYVVVTIRYNRIAEDICNAVFDLPLNVWASPDASFHELPVSVCAKHEPITLVPTTTPGGEFTGAVENGATPPGLVIGNQLFPGVVDSQSLVSVTVTYTVTKGPCTESTHRQITIFPLPVANFKTRFTTNENTEGVVNVAVSEILPKSESLPGGVISYIWDSVPDPVQPIEIKPDNLKFTIPYYIEIIDKRSVKLTLTVKSMDMCKIIPVSRTVPPVIQYLEMYRVCDIVKKITGEPMIRLSDNISIPIYQFECKNFNIRALPIPRIVDSVDFDLTGPDGIHSITSSSNETHLGYFLAEIPEPPRVIPGEYMIKATPRISGLLSDEILIIHFEIIQPPMSPLRPSGSPQKPGTRSKKSKN